MRYFSQLPMKMSISNQTSFGDEFILGDAQGQEGPNTIMPSLLQGVMLFASTGLSLLASLR